MNGFIVRHHTFYIGVKKITSASVLAFYNMFADNVSLDQSVCFRLTG